jgi:hypothetical protein
MRRVVLLATLTAVVWAPASASGAKPKPLVPTFIQKLVSAKAGPLAYVPTRAPIGYRYRRYRWDPPRRILTIVLAERRFPPDGRHSVTFTVTRFGGTLSNCGKDRGKTLQMGGNKVYWNGTVAWRCLRAANGRLVKLAASGPNLPDVALGRVAASAKRVL